MEALRVGDPMEEATQVGPLATPAILEDLDRQVRRSVEMGARVLTGGRRLERPGNYYAPTVLADVPAEAPAYREELFGPVAVLVPRATGSTKPSAWPTTPSSAWAPAPGPNDESEQRALHRRDRSRHGVHQRHGGLGPAPALRRHQALGLRPRVGAYGIREFVNIKTVRVI